MISPTEMDVICLLRYPHTPTIMFKNLADPNLNYVQELSTSFT